MRNPYQRCWYRCIWIKGTLAGKDLGRTRANNPYSNRPDRSAWRRGFEAGRAELKGSILAGVSRCSRLEVVRAGA